jgi:dihydropteroate synthase
VAGGDDLDATLPAPIAERTIAMTATSIWAVLHGAGMLRVHDVASARRALAVATGEPAS